MKRSSPGFDAWIPCVDPDGPPPPSVGYFGLARPRGVPRRRDHSPGPQAGRDPVGFSHQDFRLTPWWRARLAGVLVALARRLDPLC